MNRTIVHLRPSNFFGGPEKQIVEQSLRLAPRGWRPIVASFREGRDRVELVERAAARGLETALIESSGPFDPRAVGRIRDLLRTHDAAALVTHGYKADITGFLAGRATRTPVVAWVRGFTGESRKVRLYEFIDRLFLKRMCAVIAVSHATAEMLRNIGVEARRLHVIRNAALLPPDDLLPADLRTEFSIPMEAPLLVAAGRFSPEKGHSFLIDAVASLAARRIGVHAVLLGEGPSESSLRHQARRLGLDPCIHFAGFRNDVLPCLKAADLVVNPSLTEGLPNVVLEAMSVGVPVVATAVGGVPELIVSDETGWLTPSGDAEALAAGIATALLSPERARRIGSDARHMVRLEYAFDASADRFSLVLQRVLAAARSE